MIALSLAEIAAVLKGELRPFGDHTVDTVVDGVVDTDSRQMGPGAIWLTRISRSISCWESARVKPSIAPLVAV